MPPYLIALAVGRLERVAISPRVAVFAEPSVVGPAAEELADTEAMLATAEELFGPYRWGRYDVLFLPPAFPYGGMENPLLTFATPTILAGDRSLVALVAHELAHSWSGNLVTNATWEDFWLNEGFTVYCEKRIVEAVYGAERARMEMALDRTGLEEELAEPSLADGPRHRPRGAPPGRRVLGRSLRRGPAAPTDRGWWGASCSTTSSHLVRRARVRERQDRRVRGLPRERLASRRREPRQLDLEEWLRAPGLPADAPRVTAGLLAVDREVSSGWPAAPADLRTEGWNTFQWLRFLQGIAADAAPCAWRSST